MTLTDYELERQKRIEENKARMAQLGLAQTVTQIETTTATERSLAHKEKAARRAARERASAPQGPPPPRRRSGRISGEAAVVYDGSVIDTVDTRTITESLNEEVYTMEHVKALGTFTKPWTCFVDGYDEQGNRIYDKVNGQTCHQCRQKTLGLRTSCSECQSLTGQLCGDCLFQRYGENIEEVNENPDWVCPYCRDLCNCSFHRSRRGWAPTGAMAPRAQALGFASVAHYLVLNHLDPATREEALPYMPEELANEIRAELEEEKKEVDAAAKNKEGGRKEGQENSGAVQEPPSATAVGSKRKAEDDAAVLTAADSIAEPAGAASSPARVTAAHGALFQKEVAVQIAV